MPSAGKRAPILQGVTILVVDDTDDARELISLVLENAGATVVQASSVADALGAVAQRSFRVLVSDIGMPVHDGYELIRCLRAGAAPQGRSLAAIAVTAFGEPADRQKALAAGFQEHLVKPVSISVLVNAIASVLERTEG